jgi:outer membrane lipoprotein-sorting protein
VAQLTIHLLSKTTQSKFDFLIYNYYFVKELSLSYLTTSPISFKLNTKALNDNTYIFTGQKQDFHILLLEILICAIIHIINTK